MAQSYAAQGFISATLLLGKATRLHPQLGKLDPQPNGFVVRRMAGPAARPRTIVHGWRSMLVQEEVGRLDVSGGRSTLEGNPPLRAREEVPAKPPQTCSLSTPRRRALLALCVAVSAAQNSYFAQAEENGSQFARTMEKAALDSIGSFLDPDEVAPSGRKIPKAYAKHVKDVVKTLRDSLADQSTKNRDIRRKADPAKEAIRNYIVNWRGAKELQSEESYTALERVLRALGAFYQRAGPSARLPDDLRQTVLKDLELAENSV